MSSTAAIPLNRRTRSRPPSVGSSRRSDDPTAGTATATTTANGNGNGNGKVSTRPASQTTPPQERTVKKLRLSNSKALTIPEGTTVSQACRRMAARRVDAVLLTDAGGLLSGIVTDIATRVIAEGLRVEQTIISKIMTRNPLYVTGDTPAIEALQKMVDYCY